MGRYHDRFVIADGPTSVGWLGHDAVLDTAYFEVKGEHTPEAASCIRRHWPMGHTVSRLDACEDYDEAGSFDRLTAIMDEAKDPRVKSKIVAPRDGDRGRTIYWGSPTSRAMVRVYEAGKMQERLKFGRPNWVRAEAQVRPGKALEKRAAAQITPLEAWGFSAWSKRAAEVLSGCELPRFAPPQDAPTFDRTTLYLARTFRNHWAELLADLGDWECIGREFAAVWQADDEAKAATAEAIKRRG